MRYFYLILAITISCTLAPTDLALADTPLEFTRYLEAFGQQSSEALDKTFKIRQAQLRLDEAESLYSSSLTGSYSKNRITEGAVDLQSSSYNIQWDQIFTTGTTISTRLNKEGFGVLNQSTQSVTLSQSIWRNAFGKQTSLSKQYARSSVDLSEKEKLSFNLRFCLQAAKNYGAILLSQKQVTRSKKRLDDARRVFDRFQTLHKKNLIRKIDFFNAKDNFLQTEKEYQDRLATFQGELISLKPLLGSAISQLQPFPEQKKSTDVNFSVNEHPYSREAQQRVLAAEQALISQKNTENFDMRLFISGQKSTSEIKDDQSATAYGVSLDYTIADPQNRRQIEEATLSLVQARALQSQSITSLEQSFLRTRALIKKLEANIDSNLKRLKNSQQRVAEASRLLDTVQLEITDYISYQQQMRTIEDQIQNDQIDLYLNNLESEILKGFFPNICQGIS